jgi:hypothetical protein
MRYDVRHFKTAAVALKELEPLVRNGKHLRTGKPFKNFGKMRSREILANWLICAAANAESRSERLTFVSTSDPIGGDGVMFDTETKETWPTEHVMALAGEAGEIEARILESIALKQNKGAAYATGKTLVVLLEGGKGPWFPNRLARALPNPLHFGAILVVGLQGVEAGEYMYNVTQLDEEQGIGHVWRVRIAADFDKWRVERVQ